MNRHGKRVFLGVTAALFAGSLAMPVAPASAQGLFETIFSGSPRDLGAAPARRESADPFTSLFRSFNRPPDRAIESAEAARGPATAFCVRSCDGHYFPVRAHAGMSAAQACRAFCPASETRSIPAANRLCGGTRRQPLCRAEECLPLSQALGLRLHLQRSQRFRAGAYRRREDPTLRPGDVVATEKGLVAFTGAKDSDNETAAFTPVQSFRASRRVIAMSCRR